MTKWAALVLALTMVGLPSPVFSDDAADIQLSAEKMMLPCQEVIDGLLTQGSMICVARLNAVRRTVQLLKQYDLKLDLPYCTPRGVSNQQAARIFVKYGNDHPEHLNVSAEEFIILALRNAYPCSQ